MKLLLYITDACSLCDAAMELIVANPELAGHILETVDIAADDVLFEQFADSIPVLEVADNRLSWPFTERDISILIQTKSSHSLE